jgi:hypothetical protein
MNVCGFFNTNIFINTSIHIYVRIETPPALEPAYSSLNTINKDECGGDFKILLSLRETAGKLIQCLQKGGRDKMGAAYNQNHERSANSVYCFWNCFVVLSVSGLLFVTGYVYVYYVHFCNYMYLYVFICMYVCIYVYYTYTYVCIHTYEGKLTEEPVAIPEEPTSLNLYPLIP